MEISFEGQTFCFTGKLAELKRTKAEREVRARKGFTQKVINENLDYLVIGSIPSKGWKYGSYGNKIEKARALIKKGAKLKLISENDFMVSLEEFAPVDSGEIDEKIVICRYSAFVQNGEFDIDELEKYIDFLKNTKESHVSATLEEPFIYQDLYNQYEDKELENMLLFKCRLVKHFPLNENCQKFIDDIAKGFEKIKGLDGELKYSEKKEGSANFANLINEIPNKTKLKD